MVHFKRLVGIFVLLAMSFAGAGCTGGTTTGSKSEAYETPQSAFDAAIQAGESEDWSALCGCMTPDSVDVFAGGLVVMGSMMESLVAMGGPEAAEAAKKMKEAMDKHGVESGAAKKLMSVGNGQPSVEDIKKTVEPIKDKPAFIADVLGAMKDMKGGQSAAPPQLQKDAKLIDVKIDGDTATANVDVQGQKRPIAFKRIEGGWLLDLGALGPAMQ